MKETDWLNSNPCISGKPVVYLINLNEDKFIKKKSKWLPKVNKTTLLHTTPVVSGMQEVGFVPRAPAVLGHVSQACCIECGAHMLFVGLCHVYRTLFKRHYCICAAWLLTVYICRFLNGSRIMVVNPSSLSAVSLRANWLTCPMMSETSTAKRYALPHVPLRHCAGGAKQVLYQHAFQLLNRHAWQSVPGSMFFV